MTISWLCPSLFLVLNKTVTAFDFSLGLTPKALKIMKIVIIKTDNKSKIEQLILIRLINIFLVRL